MDDDGKFRRTRTREEGYFRREWNLAVNRTLDMAHDKAFLLPVVIDGTTDAAARVPEKFREVQWTRLSGGEATAAFVARVGKLLGVDRPEPVLARPAAKERDGGVATPAATSSRGILLWASVVC